MTNDPQAFDEDEDLFDFPDVAGLEPLTPESVEAEAPASQQPAEEPSPAIEEELLPEPAAFEATPVEPVEIPPAIAALANEDALPEGEDEDLFAFEELLLDPVVVTDAAENVTPEPAPAAVAPVETPATAHATASEEPAVQPAAEPVAADEQPEAEQLAPVDLETLLAALPEGTPEPARRGRTVEILALCFLVANTALVLFAWRAGDDFRATLDHVGDAVTSAVAEGQVRAASEVAAQLRAQVPATPAPTEVRVEVPVVPSPDLTATSLDLAREALDAGRFEEARRGLARLLANRDRAMLPEEMVLEARRLVALSYHLQGQALAREEQ